MTLREYIRKCQFPILIALGSYPATVVLSFFLAPQLLYYTWILPAVFAVMTILLMAIPGKLRIPLGICGAVLLVLPCFVYLHGQNRNIALIFAPAYAFMLLWCLFLPSWDFRREIPAGWLGICFATGMIGCFFAWLDPRLAPLAPAIRACFVGFIFLALLSLNRGSVNLALGLSQSCPVSLRRKNQILTIGIFSIAALVAMVPWLIDLMEKFIMMVLHLLFMLRNLEEPAETTEAATFVPETTENWMDVVLDGVKTRRTTEAELIIIGVIAVTVAALILYFAARRLIEVLKSTLGHLSKWMETVATTQQDDFIDEISDTRDDATVAVRKKRRERILPPRNMSPTEKIRYRYRRLLAKHPEWKQHHTARENLPEEAAKLYERARYSGHPITCEDAEQFQSKTK